MKDNRVASTPFDAVAFYDRVASSFHASYGRDRNRRERVALWRRYFDVYAAATDTAYDIGCGSGVLTCELAMRVSNVIGIDGSSAMLAIAASEASKAGLNNITFCLGHVPDCKVGRFHSADLIIASSSLEYIPSLASALDFVAQLLRPKGTLIFSVSNRYSISRAIVRQIYRLSRRPRYLGFVCHFLSIAEIKSHLERAGFTYAEHVYFGRADYLNRILALILPDRYSSNMILVVAKRTATTNTQAA